jgi:sporulation protein YlmC with PRC-barrel domain
MKKLNMIFTLLIAFSLILAACADTGADEDGTGLEITPGILETDEGLGNLDTPEVMEEPTEIVATEEATLEATAEPQVTEPSDTSTTATPTTGEIGGVAGDEFAANTPYRLSNLLDFNIQNQNGDELGDVESVIVSRDSGQIHYVVVAAGGFLGLGEQLILVPYDAFSLADIDLVDADVANDRVLVLNVEDSILAEAPTFDVNALPDLSIADWDADYRAYWADHLEALPVTGETQPAGVPLRFDDVTDINAISLNTADASTSNPSGMDVKGDDVGDVEDILVDPQTGQVMYVMLATHGFMDLGERLIPVTWEAVTWDTSDDQMYVEQAILRFDPQNLANAPYMNDWTELPDLTVEGWDAEWESFWQNVEVIDVDVDI